MKKAKCLVALLFVFSIAFAQQSVTVPKEVESAFKKDYPHLKGKWEMEENNYEVNFTANGKKMSAIYTPDGSKLESEVSINASELPAATIAYINTKYPKGKIQEASMITKANGEVTYETRVSGREMIFSKDGKYIRTTND
jgi:hypothetical protein